MAFNNDGGVSGSKDCGFIGGGNEDGWIYASDDKIVVGNDDGSSEVLLDFGVDDGSCKTIRKFSNTILYISLTYSILSCTIPFAFIISIRTKKITQIISQLITTQSFFSP